MTDPQKSPYPPVPPLRLAFSLEMVFALCIGVIAFETIVGGPGAKPIWYWVIKAGAISLCFVFYLRSILLHRGEPR